MDKIRAIWRILTEDEFFLMTASIDRRYSSEGPIKYSYGTNTDREMFFVFLNEYLKNHHN